jgi:hypothetical protein
LLSISPTINTTTGTNTIRGFYYNPTLTSDTGTTQIALETVTGSVIFSGDPVTVNDVLTLPFKDPLPTGKPTASIALSGSGGTFEGMYVYNGTAWTKVGP